MGGDDAQFVNHSFLLSSLTLTPIGHSCLLLVLILKFSTHLSNRFLYCLEGLPFFFNAFL